jgi:hypothetical protein
MDRGVVIALPQQCQEYAVVVLNTNIYIINKLYYTNVYIINNGLNIWIGHSEK